MGTSWVPRKVSAVPKGVGGNNYTPQKTTKNVLILYIENEVMKDEGNNI